MISPGSKNKNHTGKKRKLWPVLSALLVLCYAAVFVWYFVYGFGNGGNGDENTGGLAAVVSSAPPVVFPSDTGIREDAEEKIKIVAPAVKVKGLYITAWNAGIDEEMAHYIELCDTTEINALVIDVKDDRGQITFITDTESISGAGVYIIPDIKGIISSMKSHGIYSIARVVCFNDPMRSKTHPDTAIHNLMGEPWKDHSGNTWLDPYNKASWDYIADVALEAARVGFDEVQLDYVRFPSDGNIGLIDYGAAGADKSKAEIISEFVAYIRAILAEEGVRLSADVFGIIAISSIDSESIGQDMGLLLHSADYLCPMIYPSHFANKSQNGTGQIINNVLFEAPDLEPYGVVYNILLGVADHLDDNSAQAGIRPYIQDFTAAYLGSGYYQRYTAQQVLEQIKAVYDAGFDEWIIWNHSSVYSEDAFKDSRAETERPRHGESQFTQ